MTSSVEVVTVVAGEPEARLARLGASLAAQDHAGFTVRVAAPRADHATVRRAIVVGGAVLAVDLVDNPTRERSRGLNRATAAVTATVVCRVDARSLPPVHYVTACVERLDGAPGIGVVGGHQVPLPGTSEPVARAVARVLADPIVAGGAAYRRRSASGPVDTVYLGTYRTSELRALGGWAEDLTANEDFELCQRYRASGYDVWLEADLDVGYEARATVASLWKQYAAFGAAKVGAWRRGGMRPQPRQLVGVVGPPALLAAGAGLAVVRPGAALAALGLSGIALGALEARRPGGVGARVRAAAALLTPVPATAFAGGAVCSALRRRAATG